MVVYLSNLNLVKLAEDWLDEQTRALDSTNVEGEGGCAPSVCTYNDIAHCAGVHEDDMTNPTTTAVTVSTWIVHRLRHST